MFQSIKTAWTIISKKDNIRNVLEATYNVIIKAQVVIDIIPVTASPYVVIVKTAIETIKKVIEKYGPIVGFETIVYAQSDEDPSIALINAIEELKAAVESK